MDLSARVIGCFEQSMEVTRQAAGALVPEVVRAAQAICDALLDNGKLLACGNGGSAADAQHLCAQLVNRFELERPGLPAIALPADGSALTSIASGDHFDQVFARQVQALGQPGDVLVAITASGQSENVLAAISAAHERDIRVILLSGRHGGLAGTTLQDGDVELRVPSDSAARIQEVHILLIHCLCDLIDCQLFGTEL